MWKWRLICWLIRLISRTRAKRVARLHKLRDHLTVELDSLEPHWSVYYSLPKHGHTPVTTMTPQARVAVVVQGPTILDDGFTAETIRIYRNSFPTSDIILSTWTATDPETIATLDAIEATGAYVLRNSLPAVAGLKNINFQITSTRRGVEKARQLGAKFVLKTRADTRLLAPNVGDYLAGLWQLFPTDYPTGQRGRLAIMDLCTRLYLPNHPSDILMFGDTEDMLSYWSAPLHPANIPEPDLQTVDDLLACPLPEVHLCEHYMTAIGYRHEPTLQCWWQALRELFLVVDRASLQCFWPKYNYYHDQRLHADDEARNMALCSFRDWINLYAHQRQPTLELTSLCNMAVNAPLPAA